MVVENSGGGSDDGGGGMVSDGRGPSRWSMRERRVAWQPSYPRRFVHQRR